MKMDNVILIAISGDRASDETEKTLGEIDGGIK